MFNPSLQIIDGSLGIGLPITYELDFRITFPFRVCYLGFLRRR